VAHRAFGAVLVFLRHLAAEPAGDDASDRALLERFGHSRDEAAFEALLRRHGPMVLAVCRRVLNDVHAAEDAFQATFIVLARKAGSLRRQGTVAGWLYTVAHRCALRAKSAAARRREREGQVRPMPPDEPSDDLEWRELRPVLDDEVSRLPDPYRTAFVLCHLEGKTNEEAARALGCPTGTVLSRLSRARERLRDRLTRRGVVVSTGTIAAALEQSAAPAAVPAVLVSRTLQAALHGAADAAASEFLTASVIAKGVMRTMMMTRAALVAAVLVAVGGIGGGGLLAYRMTAADALRPVDALVQPAQPDREDVKKAEKAIRAASEDKDIESIKELADDPLLRSFPGFLFFDVRFTYDYGVPLGRVKGSSFWVVQTKECKPTQLGRLGRADVKVLQKFMQENLKVTNGDARMKDAAWACLRVAQEALTEHGWMTMTLPEDSIKTGGDKEIRTATGKAVVKPEGGAGGEVVVTLRVDDANKVKSVEIKSTVHTGPKPKCHATKLLDPDPVIRAMAEQQLLLMGRRAEDYVRDRRAKADADLRKEIDRVWQRVVAADPQAQGLSAPLLGPLVRPPAALLQHPDRIVREIARQQLQLLDSRGGD